MSSPIEDYGLIGDGETAALVRRDGSIDWFCWPRFDLDACFAALVGTPANGRWRVGPAMPCTTRRRYREDTLILETEHESETGIVRVIDFMPIREMPMHGRDTALIRIIEGVTGTMQMRTELCLRGNYGAVPPWFEAQGSALTGHCGAVCFTVTGSVGMQVANHDIFAEFEVGAGDVHHLVLQCSASGDAPPIPVDPLETLRRTTQFWQSWIGKFDKTTDWPEAVRRSLITLKAMIYRPSGAMVAAPTTSLPEAPGGKLNWDYRFCWIRDASFTICAFLNAGFDAEAKAWRDWLLRTIGSDPKEMRIMYRVNGERNIPESEIEWLDGYNHSRPVRLGNGASMQHQADVYGELLDAMQLAAKAGIPRTSQAIEMATRTVEFIEACWGQPGAGLWESRAEQRHYVYSRAMAWAGVDRFLSAPELREHAGQDRVERWEALRQAIHDDVCQEGFHTGLGRFVDYYGGQGIDACLLLLPLINFLPVSDPRISATITAIERELVEDGLVRRKPRQGKDPEGTFIACTLWLADCQNMQGRHEAARATLERVLAVRNDLGLLSEEYNVAGKHLAGNFPQALSHLALVNTALGLCGPVLQRGGG